MSKDLVLKVGPIGHDRTSASVSPVHNKEAQSKTLVLSSKARMDEHRFSELLAKLPAGGVVLADQCFESDRFVEASYVSLLKRAGDNKRVFTPDITTVDVFSIGSDKSRSALKTPYSVIDAAQRNEKIGMIVTFAKPNTGYIEKPADVVSALVQIAKSSANDSYTPKIIIPLPENHELELYAKRDQSGRTDWNLTAHFIEGNQNLIDALSGGPLAFFPAASIRISDISCKALCDRMIKIRHGSSLSALERFMASIHNGHERLFGSAMIATEIRQGQLGQYEYATDYRPLGKGRSIKDFLND